MYHKERENISSISPVASQLALQEGITSNLGKENGWLHVVLDLICNSLFTLTKEKLSPIMRMLSFTHKYGEYNRFLLSVKELPKKVHSSI